MWESYIPGFFYARLEPSGRPQTYLYLWRRILQTPETHEIDLEEYRIEFRYAFMTDQIQILRATQSRYPGAEFGVFRSYEQFRAQLREYHERPQDCEWWEACMDRWAEEEEQAVLRLWCPETPADRHDPSLEAFYFAHVVPFSEYAVRLFLRHGHPTLPRHKCSEITVDSVRTHVLPHIHNTALLFHSM